MRLQKVIRDLLNISRRDADAIILQGRVFVNGIKAVAGQQVEPGVSIQINAKTYEYTVTKNERYYLLYKPIGYVCSNDDVHAEKLVTELIPNGSSLKITGRLDQDSEGLVLLTTDGDLVQRLTHPKFEIEKVYEVIIQDRISEQQLEKVKKGIQKDGVTYTVKQISTLGYTKATQTLRIILTEGKKREIREILASLNKKIVQLKRISIGPFSLGQLQPGKYTELSKNQVATLMKKLKG